MKSETVSAADLLSPELVREIQAVAEEEHREAREIVGEAVRRYLDQRRSFRPDETHQKIARGLESLRRGKSLDGEATMRELLAELDTPAPSR